MKVQKMDNRYKYFKYGFTHVMRANLDAEKEVKQIKAYLTTLYGECPWLSSEGVCHDWFGTFEYPRGYSIYVRDEKAIMMVQLALD